jgi:hypothetical protein
MQTPTSMTIVWRTDTATDSRVRYGTVQASLTQTATNATVVTNHVVTITGLSPATKYYYDAGSTTTVQAGGTVEHYFVTSPTVGSTASFRAWILGDSGDGGTNQTAVRDAMIAYTGATRPNLMLHLGDIAYTSGSEQEFTDFHFNVYKDVIRHTVQWPTLGNHEGASTTSGQPGTSTGPYYDAFVLPTAAEAGGTASGTEAYYSFDYGNVHFISLNAYQVSRSASGPMAVWLQNDLAATNAQWVVAFWHHPPYTHGTHNSDSETELREMRQNFLPILEAGGVDLVLCGHSHVYERSYLIDGTYSTPTPNFATLEAQGHIVDDGDGKLTGTGAYQKGAGLNAHEGAVYVVAGHGGASTGGTLDHPVMYFSEAVNGSCILDVNGNSLTMTNVRKSGVVSDTFTIQKGPQAPKVASTLPTKSAVLGTLPMIRVTFSTNVNGVDAGDLSVNGSPATALSGAAGGSVYDFSGYAAPGNGHVGVVLAAGGISDAANGSLLFTGNTWSYTVDTTPPRVFSESPVRGTAIGVLPSITVTFTKSVTGVTAGSLRVNGQPATTLSGISGSTGPYTFSGFPAPPTGQVSVSLLAGGIMDELSQPFAGDSWVYALQPHLVINEYLTSNNTSATDEFGEHDDYVEIYNPANVAVDMSGMHLTDTLDFPAQYKIPAGVVIPAHGHLVFWCDSQPGQGTFHTNFNLARAAEAVGLFDTDENGFAPIDSTSWVNATTDVPVGRFPDGTPGYVNMPHTAGATNTISCTTNPQCSALTDQCNTGVCTASRCVAAPANEGLSCDDGIACRAPDTCTAGVCDGGPSLCTGGQSCNLVTGLCEIPQADPLPIGVGVPWKYFKGTVAPPGTWQQIAFDDSTWTTGNSGFGYGPDCSTEHGTVLSDMLNGYNSLYVRRLFRVDNPAAIQSLTALVDYDDAFVMYINGHEVARNNIVGTPPSNTQAATADHECSSCNTPPCNAPGSFPIDLQLAQLVTGNNVVAIQANNLSQGSSDFTLVPTLVATEGQGCAVNPECDDANACTDDACVGSVCQHTVADGNVCTDGISCTNDACTGGVCVSTSACPVGRTCNLGTGSCDATPVTVTFQDGTSGYTQTQDTYLSQANAGTVEGALDNWRWDLENPAPSAEFGLIRFDGIVGSGAGQIPAGASITSASLTLEVTNGSVAPEGSINESAVDWAESTATWNNFGGEAGVQADEYRASPQYLAPIAVGSVSTSVTASVQAFVSGTRSNFGWVFRPNNTDGAQVDSAEFATASLRPKLSVTYTFSPPCSVDADCTDNNVCNGIETCVATVCQAGTALVCNDGNGCTTDSCIPASGCVNTNNANPCSDGNACTSNDTCSGGSCVAGAPTNCNDGNVCTDDSCNVSTGCVHANNSASCSDSNLCTTGDVCSGGTCGGTAVSCPIGQTCNTGTGTCQSGPTTVTFQQGASGYTGSVDTYIDAALGSQATVSPIVIDGSPVEQALLRFDSIFGSSPNQIPAGSTISSATLTLWVGANTSDESTDTVSFHRLLHAWSASDVWAAYGVAPWNGAGGIQNDGVDAVAASSATATMTALATAYPVDVTTSLQAWSASPASNFGWAILPPGAGTNGLRLESTESATASNARRPLLSVTFTAPAAGCSVNADCNDNNACNGIETCVSTVCQAGSALNCDDGNLCTTDSCVPATGCAHVNNTISCSDGNACTANDACVGGTCVGGAAPNCDDANPCTDDSCNTGTGCVHANNTASCSDGNLCTTGDVCGGGFCNGVPVGCPVGQSCNPTNGLCEASANPPLPIAVGDTWRYFKGTVEPAPPPAPPTWATTGFDDSLWLSGPSGFGYGPDCTTQRGTTLADMQNPPTTPGYMSIYVRKKFDIANPAAVTSLTVGLDYDDAAIVYINGVEVARTTSMGGTVGTPTAFSAPAAAGHECSLCDGPPCNPAQSFPITLGPGGSPLVAGTNVIAIHAHNQTLNSSDFTLIPTASATFASCTVNADCNDGVSCTNDTCQTGTCVHASNCSGGQTCNVGTGFCESAPVTATFQDGVSAYTGTQDTYLAQAAPGTVEGALDNWRWDSENPAPNAEFGLIRFDNLFGAGPGQIPPGSTINSAVLTIEVANGSVTPEGSINESSVDWSEATATWNNFGGEAGVQADEYLASPAYVAPIAVGSAGITVTSSVQAWSSGSRNNFGWVFRPNNLDGAQVDSAEFATVALRPKLTVIYVSGCSSNAQCDDGNLCNGLETCSAGSCQAGTALNCTDNNPCTTDSCDPGTGCHFVNNTAACNDGSTCTTGDVCSGGSCVGTPLACDDGVACTTDTCSEGLGCQHPSNCAGGGSCNTANGTCTAGRMECSPSTIVAGSASTAPLEVILRNLGLLAPVRGYQTQISIVRTSGTGTVSVSCPGGVAIDDARPDYLYFNSPNDFPATNCGLRRASSSLLSGGATVPPTPAYLAGYTLTTSADATAGSTFSISLDASPGSSLVAANGSPIDVDRGPACTLTITSCTSAAECDDGNPCTADTCDLGLGCQHAAGNAGAVCRVSTGTCDVAEICTGLSPICPSDQHQPNGTTCSDGDACTIADTCQGGLCAPGAPLVCNDSNACTNDVCSGGACVYTVNGVCGITGTAHYYRDDSGAGTEPSTKPVPNVGIDRTGDAAADATTDGSGGYAFSSLNGNVTLTTVAKYGTPRASDHNGAITSFDASVVARGAASLVVLSQNQQIAADVTGDGTISAFDASFVARFAAGLIDHFNVSGLTGSDWKFLRCDTYAYPGDPGCGTPSYTFTPITGAESGKDFHAILYGDVTGNWQPAALLATLVEKPASSLQETKAMAADRPAVEIDASKSSPASEVSIDRITTPLARGERRQLTVRLENADGILGLDLKLSYDASRLRIVNVEPTGIATGWGVAHGDRQGTHRITTYGVQPLSGSGTALIVTVEGLSSVGRATPVQIDGVANEGAIPLRGTRVETKPKGLDGEGIAPQD